MRLFYALALGALVAAPALAAQQEITTIPGPTATREALRTAANSRFSAIESNFDELYAGTGAGVTYTSDCSGITTGLCVDTDTNILYFWDGNSVEQIGAGTGDDQTAAEVSIADAGNYYTGTNVEAVLQEVGAWPSFTVQTSSITTGATNILGSDYGLIADTDGDGKPELLDSAVTIPDAGTLTFDEAAADPNDADVQLSGADGVFKIAAVNGANNEDITIDLDATSNKAKIASTTSLSLITTSTIPLNGAIRTVGKGSDYTIGTDDADEAYGAIFFNTAASTRTFTLPPAVAGMSVCIRNLQGVSQILRLDAGTGDYIVKSTGARTSASGEYYGATADAKNQVCVVAYDATDWYVTGEVGTWTEE